METLENGYAISMLPLISFAMDTYENDPCELFRPRTDENKFTEHEQLLMARMHKAITIIQLKLEGQIIKRRPHYEMTDRHLLDKIDFENGTVRIDRKHYRMIDSKSDS